MKDEEIKFVRDVAFTQMLFSCILIVGALLGKGLPLYASIVFLLAAICVFPLGLSIDHNIVNGGTAVLIVLCWGMFFGRLSNFSARAAVLLTLVTLVFAVSLLIRPMLIQSVWSIGLLFIFSGSFILLLGNLTIQDGVIVVIIFGFGLLVWFRVARALTSGDLTFHKVILSASPFMYLVEVINWVFRLNRKD